MQGSGADFEQVRLLVTGVVEGIVGAVAGFVAEEVTDEVSDSELHERMLEDRKQMYAARKRQRMAVAFHPREFAPHDQRSFISGSPNRPKVTVQRVHRLPRDMRDMETTMQQWSPDDWLSHVRVSLHLFLWLLSRLDGHFISRDPASGGKPTPPDWRQLGAVLSWLGGARTTDILTIWGMKKTAFLLYRARLVTAIVDELGDESVCWPDPSEYDRESVEFAKWCKFSGVIGAIDGIIIPVDITHHDLRQVMYCARKGVYGMNVQAVANSKCAFTFVSVSHFASVHDGRAAKGASLWRELESGLLRHDEKQFFLLADNAYGLRTFMMHPWEGHHTPGSRADTFNFYLSGARATIERAFGQVVLAFPFLKAGVRVKSLSEATKVIQCCFILHNIRKSWNEAPIICASALSSLRGYGGRDAASPTASQVLRSEAEATAYVQAMGDDQPSERLPIDRRASVEHDVGRAKQLRFDLANWLYSNCYTRPGYVALPNIALQDETADVAEGLID